MRYISIGIMDDTWMSLRPWQEVGAGGFLCLLPWVWPCIVGDDAAARVFLRLSQGAKDEIRDAHRLGGGSAAQAIFEHHRRAIDTPGP